jgi:hypothetical protein
MKMLIVYDKNVAFGGCVVRLAVRAVVDGVVYVFEVG